MSQLNPNKFVHNTAYYVQPTYIAGHTLSDLATLIADWDLSIPFLHSKINRLLTTNAHAYLAIWLYIWLPLYLTTYLPDYLAIWLSINLTTSISVYKDIWLPVANIEAP